MSLKLKGIKTIANKLKQTKRDKASEKETAGFGVFVSPPVSLEAQTKLQEVPHGSVRACTKAMALDTAYGTGLTPSTRKKQRRQSSDMSVASQLDSFDLETPVSLPDTAVSSAAFSKESDSVKVFVRVRPPSAKEIREGNHLSVIQTSDATLQLKTNEGYKNFTFDAVLGDTVDQATLFQNHAAPIVERCLSGYSGCIFAYGQTGSGKTYTMLGDASIRDQQLSESAGIIPRVFKYLFELLKDRQTETWGKVEFECRCSFLEIYNETITDLLNPSKTNLQVREDKTGTHAAGLTEQLVHSMEEVVSLVSVGTANRKVAHTQMNAESSRSHSILSCIITTKRCNETGVLAVCRSRLNLVDLAGSERQSTTGATGARLKEASSINKSLSTLGLVIMSLADTKHKKPKHIPYRDSKLTFLLQDCLGGNANAVMISNISPSTKNINETLSTLRFARGAKRVKNKAVANHDCVGNIPALKAEIALLKQELKALKERSVHRENDSSETKDAVEDCEECFPQEGEMTADDDSQHIGLDSTLASALRREDAAHRTVLALTDEILLLQSAMEIKQSEIRKYKLISKLKDDKIQRLEDMVKKHHRESWGDDAEIQRLKSEVEFFKEKASKIPDATKYAIENMQLKHELSTLKWSLECSHSKEKFDQQITELREKLLEVNEEIKRYREANLEESQKQADAEELAEQQQKADVEHSSRMQLFLKRAKLKDQDEFVSRSFAHLAKWAKTVVGVLTRPLHRLRTRMKKTQQE